MSKLFSIILIFTSWSILTVSAEVIVKVKGNAGAVADNFVLKTNPSPSLGGAVDIEWKCSGTWADYWGNPNMGISAGLLNFNNSPYFGANYRVMPYIQIPLLRNYSVDFGLRVGAGISYFTKTSVINGAHLAPYMEVGLYSNLELTRRIGLVGELNLDGLNNMGLRIPSPSIAVGYASLGVRMRLGELPQSKRRRYQYIPNNPIYSFWNLGLSGGFIDYSTTNDNLLPVASLHLDYQWVIADWYATGLGTTVNYNAKYSEQGVRGTDNHKDLSNLNDFYIPEESTANKFRAGIEWDNTFMMGRFSYIANLGIFIYDPIRNAYAEETNRGLIYSYDPYQEEGFLYVRLGFRYRLYDGFAIETNVNTFAGIFDNMQFGINYTLPFTQKFRQKNRASVSDLKRYKYE